VKEQIISEEFKESDGLVGTLHAVVFDKVCRWSCWASADGVKAWDGGSFEVKPKQEPKVDAEAALAASKAKLLARVRAALAVK
jgi:hypothetical protein